MHTFATETGQRWKLRVSSILSIALVALTAGFISLWGNNPLGLPIWPTAAAYLITGIVGFLWWTRAIICPRCGKSPSWYQMRHGSFHTFPSRLAGTSTCPSCGFTPGGQSAEWDEAIARALELAPFALSLEELIARIGGTPAEIVPALTRLAEGGRVKMTADRVNRAYYVRTEQLR